MGTGHSKELEVTKLRKASKKISKTDLLELEKKTYCK